MINPATINAAPEQKAMRDIERIKTLRAALEKATGDRAVSLQSELDRRLAAIDKLKAQLSTLDV